ncbi:MAG: hypothetical protein LUF04_07175 [Bacteroides sp.]|nr:hypothetical protein [Bacteroides sp.]
MTADLETGQEISCRPGGQIRTELAAKAVSPAAALSEDDVALVPYGGIGLMGIEIDFIVS